MLEKNLRALVKQVLNIFRQTSQAIYVNRGVLIRKHWLHFSVLWACLGIADLESCSNVVRPILIILSTYSYIMLAVNTHRIMVLGPDSIAPWQQFAFGVSEVRFMLTIIGIFLLTVPFGLIDRIPTLGRYISVIAVAYVTARFSLVLPATAVGQPWTFHDAWLASSSHQFPLVLIALIAPLSLELMHGALSSIDRYLLVFSVLYMPITLYVVAAFSLMFTHVCADKRWQG